MSKTKAKYITVRKITAGRHGVFSLLVLRFCVKIAFYPHTYQVKRFNLKRVN